MRFSLLAPDLQVPNRIPFSRGVPSASALQVDTSGLPRRLPLPEMDVAEAGREAALPFEAAAEPYKALARFAAVGGEVTDRMSSIILEAEAKKRAADDLAAETGLYTQAAVKVDDGLEALKGSTDHNTFRPAYNDLWKKTVYDAVAQAPNPRVAQALSLKLAGLQVAKMSEVSATATKKLLDYHEATLDGASRNIARMITDPNASDADRQYQIAQAESLYTGYAHLGLPLSRIETIRERTLTGSYNTLAQQAMTQDPEGFLPKSEENPNGKDGYRQFAAGGQYPADPKYLNSLIDTTGPNLLARKQTADRLDRERRETQTKEHLTNSWGQRYDKLFNELDSGDPARVAAATADAQALLMTDEMGSFWTHGMKAQINSFLRDTRKAGGTTNDTVYNDLSTKILENPGSVHIDEIIKHAGVDLARTGERSAATLIAQQRQLQQTDDVSHRPDYQKGHEIIVTLSAGATDFLALYGPSKPSNAPANIERNRNLYGDAIAEFDREARKPEWRDKNLVDLAIKIRNRYMPLVYSNMGVSVDVPTDKPDKLTP